MSITVYHNPESPASCDLIAHLSAQGIKHIVVDVIRDAPTRSDLIRIINKSGLSARELLCEKEACARGIRKDMRDLTQLLNLMAQNPRLIDHPLVIGNTGSGRVCRTAAMVEGLI